KDARPVTSWPNRDEAFTNVAEGIRRAVERLLSSPGRFETASSNEPAARPKPLKLDIEQFGKDIARQEVKEIKITNPYLLGDKFVGREKELNDLTDWLRSEKGGILCICDLGGTGKSALVWSWLNLKTTRGILEERGLKQFWCSFYARNFDSIQFLRN